jgi:hypothetical protein
MVATLKVLDSLVETYNIDKNRLYIYGISMGGFGVFSVLAKEPEKFAAAYAICGGSSESAATSLLNTPLWIFHGEMDDIVDVKLSRQIYHQIKAEGGKVVRYTEYPGVKHNSWENVSSEKTLHHWLLRQGKNVSGHPPDKVKMREPNLQANNVVDIGWSNSSSTKSIDNEIWYYKLFRDNKLLAEINGDVTNFKDRSVRKSVNHIYYVVGVNYHFRESERSNTVSIGIP